MYDNRAAGNFSQKERLTGAVLLLLHISVLCKYSQYV